MYEAVVKLRNTERLFVQGKDILSIRDFKDYIYEKATKFCQVLWSS